MKGKKLRFFRSFLEMLSDDEAEALWTWLDETPDVIDQMVEKIAKSHRDLTKKLCKISKRDRER